MDGKQIFGTFSNMYLKMQTQKAHWPEFQKLKIQGKMWTGVGFLQCGTLLRILRISLPDPDTVID